MIRVVLLLLILLALDAMWIGVNKQRYMGLVHGVQKKDMQVNTAAAIVAYGFVALTVVAVMLPLLREVREVSWWNALRVGGVLGACVYGVFNATNMAMFAGYDWRVGLMDTLWGTTLFTVIAYLAMWFKVGKAG